MQLERGVNMRYRARKYRIREETIKSLKQRYLNEEITQIQYLENVALLYE